MTSRNSGSLYFKCFHCKHILFGRLEVQLQLFSVTKKARALKSWLIFNPVITLETPTVRCSVQTALFKQHTQPLISPERLILHFFPSTITSHVRPYTQSVIHTHTHKVKTRFLGMGPHTLFCLSSWKPWHMCLSLGAA